MKNTQVKNENLKTFIYGDLPEEERKKFLEFMISNNVEFSRDPIDNMYIATIKIVNINQNSPTSQPYNSARTHTSSLIASSKNNPI